LSAYLERARITTGPVFQPRACAGTAWTRCAAAQHDAHAMGVLRHIKKLDDALGHFLVQITCKCGAQRILEPEALARLCGASATLEAVGRRMRCSKCGDEGRGGRRCLRAAHPWPTLSEVR